MSNTVIGKNTFLDNQIHIAHNVKIGENGIIAGQVGIAGSSVIGKNVKIGGQAGISGHLKIGDNVEIAGGSGVTKRFQIDYQSIFRCYAADGTTERLRIASDGRFGFGTSSPSNYALATFNSANGIQLQGDGQSRI